MRDVLMRRSIWGPLPLRAERVIDVEKGAREDFDWSELRGVDLWMLCREVTGAAGRSCNWKVRDSADAIEKCAISDWCR